MLLVGVFLGLEINTVFEFIYLPIIYLIIGSVIMAIHCRFDRRDYKLLTGNPAIACCFVMLWPAYIIGMLCYGVFRLTLKVTGHVD